MNRTLPHSWLAPELLQSVDPSRYPALFQEADWGWVRVQFQLGPPPRPDQIGAVNLLPTPGDRWLLIQHGPQSRHRLGEWSIPGGSREPNESIHKTALREMVEETGLLPDAMWYFGAWRCRSQRPEPHQAGVPHPVFYRLVGLAAVDPSVPSQLEPPTGEIQEIALLPLTEALTRLSDSGRADLADLLRLAAALWNTLHQHPDRPK